MKRALLIFNPEATSVSPRVRDVITRALGTELKLELAQTKRRHHATHLAAGAAHDGFDLVVVLSGDGTLNEAINGLAGTDVPVLPLPGGGTNVFARTLGYPEDPIEATAVAIERLQDDIEPMRINLGEVNGRAFAFCAGIGFDAAVVRAVERRMRVKRTFGEPFFALQAVRVFFFAYPRRGASLTVSTNEQTLENVRTAVVCNSNPYTFWGSRPFQLCPDADLERGLDVTALTRFNTPLVLRTAWRAFGAGGHLKFRSVHGFHDLDALTVDTAQPMPYQVDGDLVGEATRFKFRSLPGALRVIC